MIEREKIPTWARAPSTHAPITQRACVHFLIVAHARVALVDPAGYAFWTHARTHTVDARRVKQDAIRCDHNLLTHIIHCVRRVRTERRDPRIVAHLPLKRKCGHTRVAFTINTLTIRERDRTGDRVHACALHKYLIHHKIVRLCFCRPRDHANAGNKLIHCGAARYIVIVSSPRCLAWGGGVVG